MPTWTWAKQTDQDRLAHAGCRPRCGTTRGEPVYNIPVALSIMVFFALCASARRRWSIIRRETNSWGWPAFTFAYMTVLAYVAALVTYQIGMRLPAF